MAAQRLPKRVDDEAVLTARAERNGISLNDCSAVESRNAAVCHLKWFHHIFQGSLRMRLVSLDLSQAQSFLQLLQGERLSFHILEAKEVRTLFSDFLRSHGQTFEALQHVEQIRLLDSFPADESLTNWNTLKDLREVDVSYQTVRSITGLKGLRNLTHVFLSGTRIDNTSIKILSSVTSLVHVELNECDEVTDVKPLSVCSNLRLLSAIRCRNLLHFHTVADLKQLSHLDLSQNVFRADEVRRFMLKPLKSDVLCLDYTHFPPMDTVSWDVTYLSLRGVELRGVEWLTSFTTVSELSLDQSNITDADLSKVSSSWSGVSVLFLTSCFRLFTDLSFVREMTSLTILHVSAASVKPGRMSTGFSPSSALASL